MTIPPKESGEGDPSFVPQIVSDVSGKPYNVRPQMGSPRLDNDRLIFWDLDREKAFLWDVDRDEASEIEGITESGQFVFSEDGRSLFRLRVISDSDIWLIELDPESIK